MKDLVIRPAKDVDLEQLLGLYEEFNAHYVSAVPDHLRLMIKPGYKDSSEFAAALREIINGRDATILVAETGGRLVGLSEIYIRQEQLRSGAYPYAYMQSLVVSAPSRSQGIGMLLVDAAEDWARERGACEMRLEPLEFIEGLLNFYERLGYKTIRRTISRNLISS